MFKKLCLFQTIICMALILFLVGISGAKSDKKIERLKKEAENIDRKLKKRQG